jgi:hypothetical protein
LHDNVQLVPGGWEDEQLPRPPFAGADTEQFAAFTDIGRPSRAAASHEIIFDFDAPLGAKRTWTKSSTFFIKPDDPSFFIAVPFLIR